MDITLGHDANFIRFGDLALIFKVMVELNRSKLRCVVRGYMFSLKTMLVFLLSF